MQTLFRYHLSIPRKAQKSQKPWHIIPIVIHGENEMAIKDNEIVPEL